MPGPPSASDSVGAVRPLILCPEGEPGKIIAFRLGLDPVPVEVRVFEDGEHKARPLVSVRGRDVYLVQPLHGDVEQTPGERLARVLFLAGTLRDAGASRLTLLLPYLAYARKDRRTKVRDPVTVRYVAQLIEAMGVDRVVVFEAHNPAAVENAFRIPLIHLPGACAYLPALAGIGDASGRVVVSPDAGGYKRAEDVRDRLAEATGARPGIAFMEKKRSGGVVSGDTLVGDVAGRAALIVDDLISTGGTLARAAAACRAAGAATVHAVATHGLFTGDAGRVLGEAALDGLFITDSLPGDRLASDVRDRLVTTVETAPLFAEAIRRLHADESLTELAGGAV